MQNPDRQQLHLAFEAVPIVAALHGRLPRAGELMQLSMERGVDLAAMVFYKAILASPLHSGFSKSMSSAAPIEAPTAESQRIEAVIVPSSTHLRGPAWGSFVDGARERARAAGCMTDWVETSPRSSVATNARAISDVVALKPLDAKLVFVTFGQGASELRFFLQKRGPQHPDSAKIRGWINIAGSFAGAAANDRFVGGWMGAWSRILCPLMGRSRASLIESSAKFGAWRETFKAPPRTLIASLVPVPLAGHLRGAELTSYCTLGRRGPNDGAVLSLDAVARPGLIHPVLGLSHSTGVDGWGGLIERALRIFALALDERRAVKDAPPDLSVAFADPNPSARRELRLAERIAEKRREGDRRTARYAERSREVERRRSLIDAVDMADDEEFRLL